MADDGAGSSSRPSGDVAILGGPTERGDGVQILRLREGHVEVGELRAAPEGKPILGESVRLHPRADEPRICDVEVIAPSPIPRAKDTAGERGKGPAKVATPAYRSGWDAVFGAPRSRGDLPN